MRAQTVKFLSFAAMLNAYMLAFIICNANLKQHQIFYTDVSMDQRVNNTC